jgi:hypothetical protein
MYATRKELPNEAKTLWAAVLRRAVFDYVLYKGVGQHNMDWRNAHRYLFSPGVKYENGLSFEEVCEVFGWEPEYIRRMTLSLTRADIKKVASAWSTDQNEIGPCKDEDSFDLLSVVVERVDKWKTASFAVPFMPYVEYCEAYQRKMTPKVITRKMYLSEFNPMVQWQSAGA